MKHVMCAVASTSLALGFGAAGVAAAQSPAERVTITGQRSDEGKSVRVSYRDLNLASMQGEQTLNRRVGAAAHDVCNGHFVLQAQSACESYAWKGARPQIALAVRRAIEIALTGTSSIPLVAIAIVGR